MPDKCNLKKIIKLNIDPSNVLFNLDPIKTDNIIGNLINKELDVKPLVSLLIKVCH